MTPTLAALLDAVDEGLSHEPMCWGCYGGECNCGVSRLHQLAAAVREEMISPDALPLLLELVALVRGECPALLDEDRGGDARLALAIEAVERRVREGQ